jgi:hypothetical protein
MANGNGGEATSQQHGKIFERFIRDSGRFPSAIGSRASPTEAIDINAGFDSQLRLHTSIKIVGSGKIGLADAVRFYEIDRPFRFIVGRWRQVTPEYKHVTTIHELIVTPKTLARLHGRINARDVREMQEAYARFPAGPLGKKQADKAARSMMLAVGDRKGLVDLAFKSDGKTQRRLQLDIGLTCLINAVKDDPEYTHMGVTVRTYGESKREYYGSSLPLEIESTARRFSNPKASPQTSMDLEAIDQRVGDPSSAMLKPRLYIRNDDRARKSSLIGFDKAEPRLFG